MRLLVTVMLVACSSSAPRTTATSPPIPTGSGRAADQPVELVMTADTPAQDFDRNTFMAPLGWKLAARGELTVLTAPESTLQIALYDTSEATGEAALRAAWNAFMPSAKWPLLDTNTEPDHNGWSQIANYNYQTSPNENRLVSATTKFANGRWLVILRVFDLGVLQKRVSQVGLVFGQLYARGYSRESFRGRVAAKLDASRIDMLKTFVADAQRATKVPGVSFGIVQDGKTVWAGGLGVRELGQTTAVDEKTLYRIASNTKPLTTLMLAKLVDAKKIEWDKPVIAILPTFKLGSDELTRRVLVKHLVCACTGMPRQDLEWAFEWKHSTPESIIQLLGTMVPTSKFGDLFQYSNLMAAAGGYVGGHAAHPKLELGAAYDKAMKELVFDPLGMKSTTFDESNAMRENHAAGHAINIEGEPARDTSGEISAGISLRPAGAAWSNVEDLLRYVQMELADGLLENKTRYISKEALYARREPGVALSGDARYGIGLIIHDKYDVAVIDHGGDLSGYSSDVMWIPDADVGAVILTNGDLGWIIRNEFQRRLLEVLYDGRLEATENVNTAAKIWFSGLADARKRLTIPADPTESAKLADHYKSAELGELLVTRPNGATVFDFGEFKSEVASTKNPDGTVSFSTIGTGVSGIEFVVGVADKTRTLILRDAQHEYVFKAAVN